MNRRATWLFALMCVIWGIPYLLIKVALRGFEPATLVFLRTVVGATILVPIALHRGDMKGVLSYWRPLVAYTVVEVAVPWLLLSTAEQRLPSSLSGLLVATVPLVGAALAFGRGHHDDLGARRLIGLFVGLGGVAVLSGFGLRAGDVGSALLIAVVAIGYALGPMILSSQLRDVPAAGVVSWSLLLCALGYAPWGLTHLPARLPPATQCGAVLSLGVVCTAVAFVVFLELVKAVGPLRATVITYVNPAVAVLLGVSFLHENFGLASAAGFVFIIVGCLLATGRSAAPTSNEPAGTAV